MAGVGMKGPVSVLGGTVMLAAVGVRALGLATLTIVGAAAVVVEAVTSALFTAVEMMVSLTIVGIAVSKVVIMAFEIGGALSMEIPAVEKGVTVTTGIVTTVEEVAVATSIVVAR
jgi:hypothetical protein